MPTDRYTNVSEYATVVRELDLATFAERLGSAFLVRSSADGELQPQKPLSDDDWDRPTADLYGTELMTSALAEEATKEGHPAHYFVYPLEKRKGGVADVVTVGRTPNNDICIGDISLSKLHAQFDATSDGGFTLTDRGSKNGTWLSEGRLRPNRAYPVLTNRIVRFGRVRLTYMGVVEFTEFVKLTT